jgi:ribonuclease HI
MADHSSHYHLPCHEESLASPGSLSSRKRGGVELSRALTGRSTLSSRSWGTGKQEATKAQRLTGFGSHKFIVVTWFPIGDILHNKEAVGRIAKWVCELGAHDIEFWPRTTLKTQALVYFISEWNEHQVPESPEVTEIWRMYFDGSLRLQGAGAGILFIAPGGEQLKYALQLLFPTSNNAAEYEALFHGLSITVSLGIKKLMVYNDSLVVISQVNKDWDCSTDSMSKYCAVVRKLEDKFEGLEFHHVERDLNATDDALSKMGSSRA